MRRLGRILARESGQAMILAVFTFAIVTTTALTLTDVVTSASEATGQAVASNGAYQAAEAGVDEYISKLLDDPLYYQQYVDEAESTRASGSTTVSAGQAWTGGISWTYPDGENTWKQLGNGYAYNLEVIPPSGSTSQLDEAVQIYSTGCRWSSSSNACATGNGYAEREIQTVLLPSSAASWQMIANTSIGYGGGATVNGKIYANGNVSFGVGGGQTAVNANVYASGSVTAPSTYTLGSGATIYDDATNPSFSQEITSPINFSSFLTSISDTERAAEVAGVYLNQTSPPAAWEVIFQSNGTFTAAACSESGGQQVWDAAPTCGTPTTYSMPTNGAIYSNQTIIVGGSGTSSASVVDGRVTVTSNSDVVIGNDISYASGTNSILGLVATDNVIVAAWVPTNLTWYGATLAESGYWTDANGMASNPPCSGSSDYYESRSSMSFYGSTATDLGGCMSMFDTRTYNFDPTLLWLDPPWFPTIENPYTLLLQREISPSGPQP